MQIVTTRAGIAGALLIALAACAPSKGPAAPAFPRAGGAEYVFYDISGETPAAL